MLIPKLKPLRDRRWLDHVRTMPCLISGYKCDTVDPCHISTAGRGLKSPDNEVLPLRNKHHRAMHNSGEISYLRMNLPDDVLRACFRAYARELYQEWLNTQ